MDVNAPLPPPPAGDLLVWITQHPEEFSAYLHRIYALSRLEIIVLSNGVTTKYPVVFSGDNATIEVNFG